MMRSRAQGEGRPKERPRSYCSSRRWSSSWRAVACGLTIGLELLREVEDGRHSARRVLVDVEARLHRRRHQLAPFLWRRHDQLEAEVTGDRKSTRLNSSHEWISYAVFCLKKKNNKRTVTKIKYKEVY